MTKSEIHKATKFIDLSDDALGDFLLNRYEHLKTLGENLKLDPDLEKKREELKQLADERYNIEIKSTKAELKAARAIAKARGIHFQLPKDVFND